MKIACWIRTTTIAHKDALLSWLENSLGLILTSQPSVRYVLPRKDHLLNMEQVTPFSGAGEERKNIAGQM